jgi:hypothetical protein
MRFIRGLHPTTKGGLVLLGLIGIGYLLIFTLPADFVPFLMAFVIPASWVLGPVALLMILLGVFSDKNDDPFRDS